MIRIMTTLRMALEADMVSSRTIIYALGGAVVTLCGTIATICLHFTSAARKDREKIDELYDARINDLKEAHDLVDTLMSVVGLEKEKGGS